MTRSAGKIVVVEMTEVSTKIHTILKIRDVSTTTTPRLCCGHYILLWRHSDLLGRRITGPGGAMLGPRL